MKDNGAWLTLGSVAVIAGLGLTRSGLIERGSRVVGSRVVVGPPGRGYSLPTHLGYGTYNVFQRYWYGQGDPLYALLSRRGPSVDWVTVFANRREIDRLKEVSEQILATSDDEAERWTAKQVIEHTVPLARAYGLQPQGGSAALRDLLDKHGAPPQQADLWQAQRRRQLTFVDRPSIPWDATWFQKLPPDTEFRSRGISIFGGMLVYDVSTEIVFDERGEPWTQYNLYLLDNGDGRTPVRRQDVAEWVVEPGRAVNTWAGAAHIEIRKPWEGWLTIRYLLPGRRYVVRVDPADLTERDANRYCCGGAPCLSRRSRKAALPPCGCSP